MRLSLSSVLSESEDPLLQLPTPSTTPRNLHGDLVLCTSFLRLVDGVRSLDVQRDCPTSLRLLVDRCLLASATRGATCFASGCCNPTVFSHTPAAFPPVNVSTKICMSSRRHDKKCDVLFLEVVAIRWCPRVLQLLSCESQTLLVWRDTFLVLDPSS